MTEASRNLVPEVPEFQNRHGGAITVFKYVCSTMEVYKQAAPKFHFTAKKCSTYVHTVCGTPTVQSTVYYCISISPLFVLLVNKLEKIILPSWGSMNMRCTHCKPSPFGKQFCLANTAIFPSYITFQNNYTKIFNQSNCEFMKLLFVLLGKIKILPLYTVYLPHQLLHMLFFTPFRNF